MKVAIIKYNAGNIRSVDHALKRLGVTAEITDDPDAIVSADKVIFPGVGEAATTMKYLHDRGLDRLIEGLSQPVLGICLGQQILSLALGGKTFKLKFGHHGSNHPVKDLKTGKIDITVQNHSFCVDMDSLDREAIEMTHVNLNDNTLEGIRHRELPIFSVQFHPEAGPGPHDARYLFGRFVEMMTRS